LDGFTGSIAMLRGSCGHDWSLHHVVLDCPDPAALAAFWPDPAVPQQVHLDVMVEDATASGSDVLALGAVKLDGEDVYADPAGHPFCLVRRPGWAPPVLA
jgi:hypothetical protein